MTTRPGKGAESTSVSNCFSASSLSFQCLLMLCQRHHPQPHVSENGVDFFAAHPPFLSGSSFSCHSVFAGQQQSRDAHSLRLNVAGPHVSFACSFPMRGARTRKRRERHQQRVREKQRKEREQKQRMIWNKSLSLGRALLHH